LVACSTVVWDGIKAPKGFIEVQRFIIFDSNRLECLRHNSLSRVSSVSPLKRTLVIGGAWKN